MTLFRLREASRRFRTNSGGEVAALEKLNLEVNQGERIALIGPSGAGKTTLFRLLNGTVAPTSGSLAFEGEALTGRSEAVLRRIRCRIGTIYQAQHLVPQLPVLQNVLAGRLGVWPWWRTLLSRILPLPSDVLQARKCLELVEIPEKWQALTHTLSGGQRQRVAIARALMQDPPVLLADEPVSSLDPKLAREILELLLSFHGQERTLIVSLHSVDLALDYFPRVLALRGGRIFFDLPSHAVDTDHLEALFAHSAPAASITATEQWPNPAEATSN